MEPFPFRFDPRFRPALLLLGVTPSTAWVTVDPARPEGPITIRFGPWRVTTAVANVAGVEVTGPYRWIRAIGPRLSLTDRGATFGTNAEGGTCLRFHRPVPVLDPLGRLRHPGLTVTVAEPEALADLLRRACPA